MKPPARGLLFCRNTRLNAKPIAVFDSGLGGLTVLQALRARLPHEDFLYFADTRFLPYGEKPEAFLRERGVRIAERLADRLVNRDRSSDDRSADCRP